MILKKTLLCIVFVISCRQPSLSAMQTASQNIAPQALHELCFCMEESHAEKAKLKDELLIVKKELGHHENKQLIRNWPWEQILTTHGLACGAGIGAAACFWGLMHLLAAGLQNSTRYN